MPWAPRRRCMYTTAVGRSSPQDWLEVPHRVTLLSRSRRPFMHVAYTCHASGPRPNALVRYIFVAQEALATGGRTVDHAVHCLAHPLLDGSQHRWMRSDERRTDI